VRAAYRYWFEHASRMAGKKIFARPSSNADKVKTLAASLGVADSEGVDHELE
jgi:hypothetical protein